MAVDQAAVVVGAHREITVPEEASEAIGLKPGDTVLIRQTGPHTLELKALPRTLEEWWDRYPIEEPIDMKKLQEEIEEAIAADVIRELDRD